MRKSEHPTREQYLSEPRASELRGVCLQIIQNARKIMTEKEGLDPEARSKIYALLEGLQGKLIGLGIISDLHVGAFTGDDRKNPVKVAEYVAGQIFDLCGEVIHSETGAMAIAEEYDAQVEPGLLAMNRIPKQTRDWMREMTLINGCIGFLDADEEWENWIRDHREKDTDESAS